MAKEFTLSEVLAAPRQPKATKEYTLDEVFGTKPAPIEQADLGMPMGDDMGSAIMAAAEPKKQSVLEGIDLPEPTFDPAEANRLSRRGYAEEQAQKFDPRYRQKVTQGGPRKPPSAAELAGGMMQDANPLSRIGAKAAQSSAEGLGGLLRIIGDVAGSDTLAGTGEYMGKNAQEYQQAMGPAITGDIQGFGPKSVVPDVLKYTADMGEGAASSLAQSFVASALGPAAVLPSLSAVSGFSQYNKARDAGQSVLDASINAALYAGTEYAGGKFVGLDKAASALKNLVNQGASTEAKKQAGDTLFKMGVREIPGELATYLGQTGVDLLPGIGLNPNLTMAEFVAGLRDTVVQAGMMGGATAGAGKYLQSRAPQGESKIPSAEQMMRDRGFLIPEPKPEIPSAPATPPAGRIEPTFDPEKPLVTEPTDEKQKRVRALEQKILDLGGDLPPVVKETPPVAAEEQKSALDLKQELEKPTLTKGPVPALEKETVFDFNAPAGFAYSITESPAYGGVEPLAVDDAQFELEAMLENAQRGRLTPEQFAQSEIGRRLDTAQMMLVNQGIKNNPVATIQTLLQAITPQTQTQETSKPEKTQRQNGPTERQQRVAFGKALGAVQPYPGSLNGRVNLPAQTAAKQGDFAGVVTALEKSKNAAVAEVARRAKGLGTKIQIDENASETYEGRSAFEDQMSIDGAKMHLDALAKLRALAPQVEQLPEGAALPYDIQNTRIDTYDGGEKHYAQLNLGNIVNNNNSMFTGLGLPEGRKLKTKEDFQALLGAFERTTQELGEDKLRLTSTASAIQQGVAGKYDADTNTISVPEYYAKNEAVLAHEIIHAQVVDAVSNPTLAQRPAVQRLAKLYDHVKKVVDERAKADKLFRVPYGSTSQQEFIAEGLSNPDFQYFLSRVAYENTTAWDKFVETIAKLLGLKNDNAFTELLTVYGDLTKRERQPTQKTKDVEPITTLETREEYPSLSKTEVEELGLAPEPKVKKTKEPKIDYLNHPENIGSDASNKQEFDNKGKLQVAPQNIADGGVPFKSKAAATLARKSYPDMRVLQTADKGGFILAPKTPKQVAADEAKAKRLSLPMTTAKGKPMAVHQFITSEGGIAKREMNDLNAGKNVRVGNRSLFTDSGMSMDRAHEKLQEAGYLEEGANQNDARNLIMESVRTPKYRPQDVEEMAARETQADYEDYLKAEEEASLYSPVDEEMGYEMADFDGTGYESAGPEIQAEVRALLAQADALGINTESIQEDIFYETENQSIQAYYAAFKSALENAVAAGNQNRIENISQPSGEGVGFELTTQTPNEIKAKQDEVDRLTKENERLAQEVERKAQADEQVDNFALTGSNREADQAAARGQQSFLDISTGPVVSEEKKRNPSLKRKLDKLNRDREGGKITDEAFIEGVDTALEDADNARMYAQRPPRTRGADFIRQRLLEAKRRGDLSDEAVDFAEWFIQRNPQLVEDLGISIRAPKQDGVSGQYFDVGRLMVLMKKSGKDTTTVHEILHHLERMMPPDMQNAIRKAWSQEFGKATQRTTNKAQKDFFKLLGKYHWHGEGREVDFDKAVQMVKDGQVPSEFYQYVNPSEFWAVNGTDIMEGRFDAVRGGVLARLKNWLKELGQKIKSMVGMGSQGELIKALDSLSKGDGKFQSKEMLGESSTYASVGQTIFNQRPLVNWTEPEMSGKDTFIYNIQNRQIDTKRVVDAITKSIGNIDDNWNPYLMEELFHGRAAKQTKDFLVNELRPLLREMDNLGVTIPELEEYLHNKHAEERNVQVAKVNPTLPDGGSGIDTADARAYLAGLSADQKAKLDQADRMVKIITSNTRQMLVDSGLESQDTIDTWDKTYGDYVPLNRDDVDYSSQQGKSVGQGYSVRGSSSKRSIGSTRKVVDILANIAMQRERTIVRAEKNRVATALYGLALKNPNPGFWLAVNPDSKKDMQATINELVNMGLTAQDALSLMKEPTQKIIDPKTGLVTERINPVLRGADNVMAMRVNGKDRFIFFNQNNKRADRMVTALKNLDADQLGFILSNSAKVTRFFASINTQYNPVFGIYNFLRDSEGAILQLSTTELAGKQKEVMKQVMPAVRGIYAQLRADHQGKVATGQWSKLWEEFQQQGGQTGFRDQFSRSEERGQALERELKKMSQGKASDAKDAVLNWLSDYNETMENAVRLAAYKTGLDNGLSQAKSASLAKNLTVNFNRKGQIATQANALYAFFNSAVQGTTRLGQTLAGPAGKTIIGGGLLAGVVQAVGLSMAGFGDDDPPDFIKDKSFIIPLMNGKYIAFPMPLGYNVIPSTARIITEGIMAAIDGRRLDASKRVQHLLGLYMDSFNPIGNAGWSMQTFTPTPVDWLAALLENKDWTGKPIAKEDFNKLNPTPGYLRAKEASTIFGKSISKFLNYASGGSKYEGGLINATPDQIDYLIGQATGGLGREIMKAEKTARALITGEDLPPHNIPLAGRFYGDVKGSSSVANHFYDNIKKMNIYEQRIKGMRKDHENVQELYKTDPEARAYKRANETERDVQKLRKLRHNQVEKGAAKEVVKATEEKITRKMQNLNDHIATLEGRRKAQKAEEE